jgi:Cys-tRNA(Pro) deacylase
MVLAPGRGPWTLFGSVVTDAELDPTAPMVRDCGTCTACLPACPTGAIDERGLDARRCLAAWLQTPGTLPHWIRHRLDRRIYGCDDCLTVCPPGRSALTKRPAPGPALRFEDLLASTDDELVDRFEWWYIPGREARLLRRNILVAAGNSREPEALPGIVDHLQHRSALVRGHAAWALARSVGGDAVPTLELMLHNETEPHVRNEILHALLLVEDTDRYDLWLADDEVATGGGEYPDGMAPKREPVTPGIRAIRAAGIEYVPHLFDYDRYPGAAGAAEAIGVDVHSTVKTIVFETSDGGGVVALMNGDREVSTKNLARLMGVKSVAPASASRAKKWTGYEFGGTSPFGTREKLPVFCDEEIAGMGRIYINAGSRGFLVEMEAADLIRVLQPQLANLAA